MAVHTDAQQRQVWWMRGLFTVAMIALIALLAWSMRRSERKLARAETNLAQLKAQATVDSLTGLSNRRELYRRMTRAVRRTADGGPSAALLLLDLNDFKPINDRYGHAAGDEVLRIVGQRLKRQCSNRDCVARLGGDEFVVLLESVPSVEAAQDVAARITRSIGEPIKLAQSLVRVSASSGLAMVPADGGSIEDLFEVADQRMYSAKRQGKRRTVILSEAPGIGGRFDDDMRRSA